MDAKKLEELKALAEKAAPGPWQFSRESWNVSTPDLELDIAVYRPESDDDTTGEFIAAANPATVLELIAEVGRLKASLERIAEMTFDPWTNGAEAGRIARAAIAKAEGEAG